MNLMSGVSTFTVALSWEQASEFHYGYACVVREDGFYNLMDEDANFIFEKWFNKINFVDERYLKAKRCDGKYNFYDVINQKFLSEEWLFYAKEWLDNGAVVMLQDDGETYWIDENGKLTPI